jgi:hypothetical protein
MDRCDKANSHISILLCKDYSRSMILQRAVTAACVLTLTCQCGEYGELMIMSVNGRWDLIWHLKG